MTLFDCPTCSDVWCVLSYNLAVNLFASGLLCLAPARTIDDMDARRCRDPDRDRPFHPAPHVGPTSFLMGVENEVVPHPRS